MTVVDGTYVGGELELFAEAHRWKAYFCDRIRPWLGPSVLEVGAGIGGTTRVLVQPDTERWTCLEPDAELVRRIEGSVADGTLPACCEVACGTLESGAAAGPYDAVLYVDVLEHVEDDAAEARRATEMLRPGGRLIVLSPAHQWLFSPFDASIGHYRRYSRSSLSAVVPPELERVRLEYLDSVGLLASLANRMLLRQSLPTRGQIATWDRLMVPVSRLLDPLLLHAVGKSVLGVWRRPDAS